METPDSTRLYRLRISIFALGLSRSLRKVEGAMNTARLIMAKCPQINCHPGRSAEWSELLLFIGGENRMAIEW
jgi:hypothetical protein